MVKNKEQRTLKFYKSSTKSPPHLCHFLVSENPNLPFQTLKHRILTKSRIAYECKSLYPNSLILFLSDLLFILFSIRHIKDLKQPIPSFVQILIQSCLNHPVTLIGSTQKAPSLIDCHTTK